jgi:hypothetical protein
MGPFEGKSRVAQHDWMTANPGKVIIHDLALLTNAAHQTSITAQNTTEAFAKSGIWPFSRLAFSDEDFEPSSVASSKRSLFLLLAPSATFCSTRNFWD